MKTAVVAKDCHVAFEGRRYAVPFAHVGLPSALELSHANWQLLLDGIVVRERVLLHRFGRSGEMEMAAIMRA